MKMKLKDETKNTLQSVKNFSCKSVKITHETHVLSKVERICEIKVNTNATMLWSDNQFVALENYRKAYALLTFSTFTKLISS